MSDREHKYVAAARRGGKRIALDFSLAILLDLGVHVHLLDGDGEWCLADCDVPLRTGIRGAIPAEVIYDIEAPHDAWKDTA